MIIPARRETGGQNSRNLESWGEDGGNLMLEVIWGHFVSSEAKP